MQEELASISMYADGADPLDDGPDDDDELKSSSGSHGTSRRAPVGVDTFEWSDAVQRDIMHLCMFNQDFMISAQRLIAPEYFSSPSHRLMFNVCLSHMEKFQRRPTPQVMAEEVKSALSNQAGVYVSALAELEECCSEDRMAMAMQSREYLLGAVVRFAKVQAMKVAIANIVDQMSKNDWTSVEDEFRKALMVAPDVEMGSRLFDDVEDRYARLNAAIDGDCFTTGFQMLDVELLGGIRKGELAMIFAPPGVGKSIWLCHAALQNAKHGKRVLYVSLEMSEDRIANRIDAMMTGVPLSDTIERRDEVIKRVKQCGTAIGNEIFVKQFPSGCMNIDDLRAYVNQLELSGWSPDVIMLDYLDEMKISEKLDSYEGQMRATRSLRGFAVERGIAIYTATQSNRKGREVEILTDAEIGDSYGKVRIVDAMWSINQKDEQKAKGLAEVYVVKHRNAKARYKFPIFINPKTLVMRDVKQELYNKMMDGRYTGLSDLTDAERVALGANLIVSSNEQKSATAG